MRITLTREALRSSSVGAGDALNPRTWSVVRADTGFVFTVLSVREVPEASPGTVFELYLLQKLAPSGVDHQVSTVYLLAANGLAATAPRSATFDGCQAALDTAQASRNALVDLAKPQLADGFGGAVFTVGASGDYDVESGIPLLRKLFIRRITTMPGSFFHLSEYGVGVRLKEPLSVPMLSSLKSDIQRELSQEPEVDDVAVNVRFSSSGLLEIALRARIAATGTEVKDTFSIPTVSL